MSCIDSESKEDYDDPLTHIPLPLRQSGLVVVESVMDAIHSIVTENIIPSFFPSDDNNTASINDMMMVQVHNDDVHTYEEVVSALITVCGLSHSMAETLTGEVDNNGSAIAFQGKYTFTIIYILTTYA